MNLYILIVVMLSSYIFTALLRWYALKHDMLDHPNIRSSHLIPTPRGGGVAIVITFLLTLFYTYLFMGISLSVYVGLSGAGAIVAGVGFLDDHKHVAPGFRLIVHFFSAAWILIWIGVPKLMIAGFQIDSIWVLTIFYLFYLVWMINLYNFMDGINGLASVECVTVSIYSVLILLLLDFKEVELFLPILFAVAVLGFLIWNFPKAKIFMGDSGSGFIGIMLGAFSIYFSVNIPLFYWCWLILLGVFIVDSTFTLIRRVLRGMKFNEAHRTHAYQIAAKKHDSHFVVTISVIVINTIWLLPISLLVAFSSISGIIGLIVAYVPLLLMAAYINAGVEDS